MPNTAPLNALNAFIAVARRASFSAAARDLGVSASALSQSVKRLEDHLSVALLQRGSKPIGLTEAGQRLLDAAGPALDQAWAGVDTLRDAKSGEISGAVKLSVPTVAVPLILERVIPAFARRYPKAMVDVRVEDGLTDIVAEGLDAGIRLRHALERDMISARLHGACRLVVAAAPSYLARRGAPERLDDLLTHDCIGIRFSSNSSPYVWRLGVGDAQRKIPVQGPIISNDRYLSRLMAVEGLGLYMGLDVFIAAELARGDLQIVLERYARPVEGMFLYFPSRAQVSPALRAFIEVAREIMREQ